MYIIRMESSLELVLSADVIPVERPTVPNALVISKRASRNETSGSKIRRSQVLVRTSASAKSVITAALRKRFLGIEYLNAFSERFVAAEIIPQKRTNTVVVLIPPPVEPGEAPINIRTIITRSPAGDKLPISVVENPAVRVDTLWKSALSQL